MKNEDEIALNLKRLGEYLRQGLITRGKVSSDFKILTAIRHTVKEQFVSDLEQMLQDILREAPNPTNPKETLARQLKIQSIKHELAKAKEGIKKGDHPQKAKESKPRPRSKSQTVKERVRARVNLKASRTRAPSSKSTTKGEQNKKAGG